MMKRILEPEDLAEPATAGLRRLADKIERGDIKVDRITEDYETMPVPYSPQIVRMVRTGRTTITIELNKVTEDL